MTTGSLPGHPTIVPWKPKEGPQHEHGSRKRRYNGVSDSDYTVRHAAKRCTASTYSARSEQSEAEYWMLQHDAYSRRAGRCLVTAAILLCAALSCMVAMAAAPAIAMVLMGLALAGRGWWCRRNAKDAWDLSVWSM